MKRPEDFGVKEHFGQVWIKNEISKIEEEIEEAIKNGEYFIRHFIGNYESYNGFVYNIVRKEVERAGYTIEDSTKCLTGQFIKITWVF